MFKNVPFMEKYVNIMLVYIQWCISHLVWNITMGQERVIA